MSLPKMITFAAFLVLAAPAHHTVSNSAAPRSTTDSQVQPAWSIPLPAMPCSSTVLGTYCHQSSPAIADINDDGRPDIIVATNNGHVLAISGSGAVMWDRDVAPLFGMAPGQQSIESSPAIADINADGRLEIVVGTGHTAAACHPGGVVVLDSEGRPLPGWPIQTVDNNVAPSGCADPVYGTPALGDLDNDNDLEIVVGSFDHRVYAWHHDGRLLSGFPGKSDFYVTLGWNNMRNQLADTIMSSPALADIDQDGYLDIVIGTDEGMVDATFGNHNWHCPYRPPSGSTKGYCGGTLYAYDRNGEFVVGYPKRILETIDSSPAILDTGLTDRPVVFMGTGNFYHTFSPDKPTAGRRLFAWSNGGAPFPGWEGGRPTQTELPASPVIGDIAGDDSPEIIIPGMDGRLYAWHLNGVPVGGFPMTPLNYMGGSAFQNVGKSVILGDYDGDGKMEIFLTVGWSVVIVDGDGHTLTNTDVSVDKTTPFYVTKGLIQNNPALGDVDGDGVLELIVQDSELTVWNLPAGAKRTEWPMFRRNAARTGAFVKQQLEVNPPEIALVAVAGDGRKLQEDVAVTVAGSVFQWEARVTSANGVGLIQTSGTGFGRINIPLTIEWSSLLGPGEHLLGLVEITVRGDDVLSGMSTKTIPVRLQLIRKSSELFFPTLLGSP